MTDKTIECPISLKDNSCVGGDYFFLFFRKIPRQRSKKLDHYLKQFNHNDYWIYKSTGNQREVSYEDLLEFKYSGYILFKKDLYSRDHINMWIDKLKEFGGVMYLSRPFPPIEYLNKINVCD